MVVVGAGLAAAQAVAAWQQKKFQGQITVLGAEPFPPYQRPPLSKKFLTTPLREQQLYLKPESFYQKPGIALHLEKKVQSINPEEKHVLLDDGTVLPYSKLLLATGSRMRTLPVPQEISKNIFTLRSIQDALALKPLLKKGKKLVVIGGGYIGLEVAASAATLGQHVTVIEAQERVLARVTAPQVSNFFHELHKKNGVDIHTTCTVQAMTKSKEATLRVTGSNGSHYHAHAIVVGIGATPCVELAENAGLTVDNGFAVDQFCRTNKANIYAAGDCASYPSPLLHRPVRLESVQNARDMAATAADNMLAEQEGRDLTPYQATPWFWSDQYNCKLQIAGLAQDYDESFCHTNPAHENSFAIFYRKDATLIAVDAVNYPEAFMVGKKIVGKTLSPMWKDALTRGEKIAEALV